MKPDWCPPDVWQRAYSVSEAAKAECVGRGLFLGTGNALDVYDQHIARAVLEAHQRGRLEGMEEAAEIADRLSEGSRRSSLYPAYGLDTQADTARYLRNAIRAKMEEQP